MSKENNYPEVGYIQKAEKYLVTLQGLPSVKINQLLVNSKDRDKKAVVTSLHAESVEALLLNPENPKPGDEYVSTDKGLLFPGVEQLAGRLITPFGKVLDNGQPLEGEDLEFALETPVLGSATREKVTKQLITGLSAVDSLLPIAKGQRELLFGDPRSGKTSFILDVIKNQQGRGVICIYTLLGKADVEVQRIYKSLKNSGSLQYTIVISASSSSSTPVIALAPRIALSAAETFSKQGKDVLVVLDDLGVHAKYLREIALLAGRMPGRESYPGDIFYQHAQLMERCGNFNRECGGGSITLLPVIETEVENFSGFIPTNLMSATDGHLFFDSSLQAEGVYPPINVQRSVTRVGKQTQSEIQQKISQRYSNLLAEYRELQKFARFDTELGLETQIRIQRGKIAKVLLNQKRGKVIPLAEQLLLLSTVFSSFFENKDKEFAVKVRDKLLEAYANNEEFAQIKENIHDYELNNVIDFINQKVNLLNSLCL